MATRGGQPGNNNAGKGRDWGDALRRALARRAEDHTVEGGLNSLADAFLNAVADGGVAEFKELADRIEGKAPQTNILEGNEDAPIVIKEAKFVSPTPD